MTLPRYPRYKHSGVEWLGDVPDHWACSRLGALFHEVNETGNECLPILSVSIHDGVSDKEFDEDESERKVTRSDDRSKYKVVAPGDLTYNMMRAWQGGFGTVTVHGMVSPAYIVARPLKPFSTSIIELQLRTPKAVTEMKRHSRGVTDFRLRLYWDDFKNIQVAVPPEEEQTRIQVFLDHETAKIDALIAEQEKLIALLAEKRQATISHAVTRGLEPDAPMKDSGVAWLGEVPAHWDVRPLRHLSRIGNGSTPNRDNPAYWADEGFPWLNSSVVNQDEVSEADRFVTPLALQECHLPVVMPPAVLVGITGQGKTRGMATRLAFTATVSQHLAYIKPDEGRLLESHLLRFLEAAYDHLRTESEGAGSTKGAITCEQLGRFRVPVPSLNEQEAITAFLDVELDKTDKLEASSRRNVNLLKERRSALIAAAVTGQIDVRGAVVTETP